MSPDQPANLNQKFPSAAIAPRQQRSVETLNRLLDATEDLLNLREFEEITVAHIAAHAASSIGSFYARFSTKDDILIAVLERYQDQAEAEMAKLLASDSWDALDLESRARVFIQSMVGGCRKRRGVLQLQLRRRLTPGESTLPDEEERGLKAVGIFHQLFATATNEIAHDDREQALSFALRSINSVVLSAILLGSTSHGVISDEELIDRLVAMFTGYLRGC